MSKGVIVWERVKDYRVLNFMMVFLAGLPQDTHCAKRLLKQSAYLGNKHAQHKLDELDKMSTIHIKPG